MGFLDGSCLTCKYFHTCNRPEKSNQSGCNKYEDSASNFSFDIFKKEESNTTDPFSFDPTKVEDTNSIYSILDQIETNNFVPRGLKIDDRDIKQAPNFFTFTTDPRYLNATPFPRQIQIGSQYFNEICWNCSNKDWLINDFPVNATYEEIQDNIQFLEYGICPKCGTRKSELIIQEKERPYVQTAIVIGQRGGKSAVYCMLDTYQLHWALKQPNLITDYGLLPASQLHRTYTALTIDQVRKSIFDTLLSYLTSAPFFVAYNEMLDYYGSKYGEQLYAIKDMFFRYKTINTIGAVATPDIRALRGQTRFAGAIDEIGWFLATNTGSVKYNADEVHKSMLNSFTTIHASTKRLYEQGKDNVLNPILGNISSPSSATDKIMRLYEQSKQSQFIYGKKWATWEFNPTYTRKDFADVETLEPARFYRDFMCVPPASANPYISEIMNVEPCFIGNQNAFKLSQFIITTKSGTSAIGGRMIPVWEDKNTPKILAIDAGALNNSFAMTLAHFDIDKDKPVFDCIAEIIPDAGLKINFTDVCRNCINKIIDTYGVVMVVADRWNSMKILDDLEEDKGVAVETYSVKYSDFTSFKDCLLNEGVILPKPEKSLTEVTTKVDNYPICERNTPILHFALQIITVQDDGMKKVDKSADGIFTDDMLRSTVLAFSYLVDKEYKIRFSGTLNRKGRPYGLGSIGGGSSMSSNIGSIPMGGGMGGSIGSIGR